MSVQMSQLGFRLFVGVDASEGMLKEAQQTGLYQRLQLAVVGKHPLPVDAGRRSIQKAWVFHLWMKND